MAYLGDFDHVEAEQEGDRLYHERFALANRIARFIAARDAVPRPLAGKPCDCDGSKATEAEYADGWVTLCCECGQRWQVQTGGASR